ncbi:radical SAM protein [bacterium]|nr:radical SAM protein [bacterium]
MASVLTTPLAKLRRFAQSWQAPTYYPDGPPYYPEDMIVFVTERCNMRCHHCMFIERVSHPGGDFPREWIVAMAKSIPPLRSWNLTGGEPFLRADLPDLLADIETHNRPRKLQINTNALQTEKILPMVESMLERLRTTVLLQVSIDGVGQTHEDMRNLPGCFPRVERTLQELVRLRDARPDRLELVGACVLSERNYREVDEIIAYIFDKMRVVPTFDFVRGSGFSVWNLPEHLQVHEDPPYYKLPPKEALPEVYEKIRAFNRRMGCAADYYIAHLKHQIEMYLTEKPTIPCISAGRSYAVVYSDGQVAACEFTRPFAHLRDYDGDLYRLWNSPEAEARRREITQCYCTHACFLTTSMEKSRRARLRLLRDL